MVTQTFAFHTLSRSSFQNGFRQISISSISSSSIRSSRHIIRSKDPIGVYNKSNAHNSTSISKQAQNQISHRPSSNSSSGRSSTSSNRFSLNHLHQKQALDTRLLCSRSYNKSKAQNRNFTTLFNPRIQTQQKHLVSSKSNSNINARTRTHKYHPSLRNQTRKKSTTSSQTQSAAKPSSSSSSSSQQAQTSFTRLQNRLHHRLLKPRVIPIPRWISPRPFAFTISECFGHASFILVAISYATDDFLLLRIIAVAGSTSMLFFTYFHPHGRILWLPFQWNMLFILINGYRIGLSLYYEHMGNLMSDDKKRVKDDYFEIMDMRDFAKLFSIAEEETYNEGEMVVCQGKKNRYVRMVIEGELDVLRDGVKTYSLVEGNFVTEAGLHAGLFLTGTIESCCTIVAQRNNDSNNNNNIDGQTRQPKKSRCLRWDRTELMNLLKQNNGLRRSLKAILSWDIVRKLKGQRQTIAESKVDDPEFWTQKRQEQSEDRYAAILQNMLQNPDYFKKRKNALDHYRMIHKIDDDHHKQALKRNGWSPAEYEAGEKPKHGHDEGNGI